MPRKLNRRTFLKVVGGGAAAALLPMPPARAQTAPVRIGFAISETGPFSVAAGITQAPNYILWRDQVNGKAV